MMFNPAYLDPLYYMFMIPPMLFAMIAQWAVKGTFNRYSKYRCRAGMTGKDVAELILKRNGISDVSVQKVGGWLTDHYSPGEKVLRLSDAVYDSPSIAAVGVAAHEVGHALQHAQGSLLMRIRQGLAVPASFASNAAIWIIVLGMLFGMLGIAKIGVVLFGVIVLFQLVTLPVELDASRRAKKLLKEYGITKYEEDAQGVSACLTSAAMTYVAALASSVSTLLYYMIKLGLIGGRRNNN